MAAYSFGTQSRDTGAGGGAGTPAPNSYNVVEKDFTRYACTPCVQLAWLPLGLTSRLVRTDLWRPESIALQP